MVVGGDRHADRDDDGPVSRDARVGMVSVGGGSGQIVYLHTSALPSPASQRHTYIPRDLHRGGHHSGRRWGVIISLCG